jgi:hypothetical protein
MGALPLFPQGDPERDRALGALLGAARGARESRRLMGGAAAGDWPDAQTVMLHTGEVLLERGALEPGDLLRRLLSDWAQGMGRPRLLRVLEPERPRRTGHGFVAGLAPVTILRQGDRIRAQSEVVHLAALFNASSAESEAMEVAGVFMSLALLGIGAENALAPLDWLGDARVADVAAGRSRPTDEPRDFVSALDQARTLTLSEEDLAVGFDALVRVGAAPAAFILTGMLAGACRGATELGFLRGPADRHPTSTTRLEALAGRILARLHDSRACTHALPRRRR